MMTFFFGPIGALLIVNLALFAATARELTCGLWKREFVKSTSERWDTLLLPRTYLSRNIKLPPACNRLHLHIMSRFLQTVALVEPRLKIARMPCNYARRRSQFSWNFNFEFQGGVGKGLHEVGGRNGCDLDNGRDFLGCWWTAGIVVFARLDQLLARCFYFHCDWLPATGKFDGVYLCGGYL